MRTTTCLSVFLKAPEPGRVKTRLGASVGDAAATRLYRAFVRDTLAWATTCDVDTLRIDHAPPDAEAAIRELLPPAPPERFQLHPQVGGDLGQRLSGAFDAIFRTACERAAIIGTDCPTLGPREVAAALAALDSADVVLVPTADGGYCLIGLRRPTPELFREIPWSTAGVLEASIDRARRAGLTPYLLPALRDVDTEDDLAPLRASLEAWRLEGREPFPHHTAEALAEGF